MTHKISVLYLTAQVWNACSCCEPSIQSASLLSRETHQKFTRGGCTQLPQSAILAACQALEDCIQQSHRLSCLPGQTSELQWSVTLQHSRRIDIAILAELSWHPRTLPAEFLQIGVLTYTRKEMLHPSAVGSSVPSYIRTSGCIDNAAIRSPGTLLILISLPDRNGHSEHASRAHHESF